MQTGEFSMRRGRKPEERSIVSGIRFKRAIEIFGKKRTTIVHDQRRMEKMRKKTMPC
jgi:hypothetical protein